MASLLGIYILEVERFLQVNFHVVLKKNYIDGQLAWGHIHKLEPFLQDNCQVVMLIVDYYCKYCILTSTCDLDLIHVILINRAVQLTLLS